MLRDDGSGQVIADLAEDVEQAAGAILQAGTWADPCGAKPVSTARESPWFSCWSSGQPATDAAAPSGALGVVSA